MPLIFQWRGYRFFFYANEGSPREPVHVHVEKDGIEAKFWLRPTVSVAYNRGYGARTLAQLAVVVEANRDLIERSWYGFFGGSSDVGSV